MFIDRKLAFPFTHDIARLLTKLRGAGAKVPKYVDRAKGLTRFAVETRYPGLSSPVTNREYRASLRIAQAVFQ